MGLNVPLKPGQSLIDGNGYTFVRPKPDGTFLVENYSRRAIEGRTALILNDETVSKVFKEAAHTRAFDGDVKAPQVGVRSEGDRAAVAALVNNYRATNVAIANIQRNLAEQIERSRRVNLVAGQLVMLGNVFNLAGAVANFTAAFGTRAQKPERRRRSVFCGTQRRDRVERSRQ